MHGPGSDEPILWDVGSAMNCAGGSTRFLHTNHQGSIIAVADCNGNRVAVNSYDDYGIPAGLISGSAPNTGRFQYTGQLWMSELGLYYYKARMYSPFVGRFMQTDPIGYEDQVNLYAYVGNDPVNNTDPTGQCAAVQCRIIFDRIVNEIRRDPGVILDVAMVAFDIATIPSGEAAAGIAVRRGIRENAMNGARRQAQVTAELKAANPGAKVQTERLLRTADGKKAIDPVTGTGRRVDQAVIQDGRARTFETTSMKADKTLQIDKEDRILKNGGNFIRDKETRKLIPVEGLCKIERKC